jgi:hypothetical protein
MLPTVLVLTGSFASFEPKAFTPGSPVPALRNVREGRGTHNCGSFGNSKAGATRLGKTGCPQFLRSEFCPREIHPPADENSGVQDDAVYDRIRFKMNHSQELQKNSHNARRS